MCGVSPGITLLPGPLGHFIVEKNLIGRENINKIYSNKKCPDYMNTILWFSLECLTENGPSSSIH